MKHTFAAEFRATLGGSRQIRRRIAEKATFEFPVAQEKMGAMRRTKRTKLNISQAGTQLLATFLSLAACGTFVQAPSQSAAPSLGGTSWQLVKFQGSDDKTMTPDDKAKYTIQFSTDGGLSARIDCNRGRGTWKSPEPGQLQLAPLALTRAMCPPGSLHDLIVKHWAFIRSYVVRDGHLFLSLMADGGIYEFEPMAGAKAASG